MVFAALLMLAGAQDAPATPAVMGTSVARPASTADGGQRWSILLDPCAPARGENEILVCGGLAESPRLPLPEDRGPPDRAIPSNPEVTGTAALALTNAPCATRSEGCRVGLDLFGGATFLVRALGKIIDKDSCCEEAGEATNIVGLIGDAASVARRTFGKKPDKSNRVPIPLDDPAPEGKPAATGRATP